MSSTPLRKCLQGILERRTALIEKLIAAGPVVVGNVYDVMRKCGNSYCHCAVKPGHRQTLLIYTRKGRRHCKLVRREDEERIKQAWQNYRDYRKALNELRTLNNRELSVLRAKLRKGQLLYK